MNVATGLNMKTWENRIFSGKNCRFFSPSAPPGHLSRQEEVKSAGVRNSRNWNKSMDFPVHFYASAHRSKHILQQRPTLRTSSGVFRGTAKS